MVTSQQCWTQQITPSSFKSFLLWSLLATPLSHWPHTCWNLLISPTYKQAVGPGLQPQTHPLLYLYICFLDYCPQFFLDTDDSQIYISRPNLSSKLQTSTSDQLLAFFPQKFKKQLKPNVSEIEPWISKPTHPQNTDPWSVFLILENGNSLLASI